jgi:hypothetical protein
MAISRPFLLALLGVALLGATVFAVSNARNASSEKTASVAKPATEAPAAAPAPEPAQASGKLSGKDAVAAILSPGRSLDSARFSIRYNVRELDGDHEHDRGSLAGSFVAKGDSQVPDFDIRARNHDEGPGAAKNTDLRMVVAGGKPFVGEGSKVYATDATAVENTGKLRSAIAGTPVAKLPGLDLNRWLRDVKVKGVDKLDGVSATHVSGDLVVTNAARDAFKLVRGEKHDAGSQSDVVKVPAHWGKAVRRSVKSARVDAWVGPDRIVRRMTMAVQVDVPKSLVKASDAGRTNLNVDVRLSDVNKVSAVEAPSNVAAGPAAKGMGAADAKRANSMLVIAGLEVDAPGGVLGGSYSFLRISRLGASGKVSKKVLRAVEQRKPVVVFFRNPNGLDDRATAESVSYLRSHAKKLAVFTDDVENTKTYGKLLENLGVNQAPAIVFINRRGTASLIEGYVDGRSLAQVIADAR